MIEKYLCTRTPLNSYPNGRFAPRTAFVKKEGNLWITRRISSDHIWSVSDFKEKAEIVDENPNVLLVNHFVGVSRPWLEILEIQLDPELETKYKGTVFLYNKPKVLTGNVPLSLDWIKQAVIKDSILP